MLSVFLQRELEKRRQLFRRITEVHGSLECAVAASDQDSDDASVLFTHVSCQSGSPIESPSFVRKGLLRHDNGLRYWRFQPSRGGPAWTAFCDAAKSAYRFIRDSPDLQATSPVNLSPHLTVSWAEWMDWVLQVYALHWMAPESGVPRVQWNVLSVGQLMDLGVETWQEEHPRPDAGWSNLDDDICVASVRLLDLLEARANDPMPADGPKLAPTTNATPTADGSASQTPPASGQQNEQEIGEAKPRLRQKKATCGEPPKRRGAWARDHEWLKRYLILKTYGAVRDWWNGLTNEQRAPYAPCHAKINAGKAGWSVVQKGIEKARDETEAESER